MRVVVVAASLDAAGGGSSEAIRRMAEATAGRGHSVTLVQVSAGGAGSGRESEDPNLAEIVVARVGPGAFSPETRAILRREIAECDVVHVHGIWEHPTWAARVEALRAGRPMVLSPHGALSPWAVAHRPWRKRVVLALWERRLLARTTVFVATGDHEARDLRALQPEVRVETVPHGIKLPDAVPASARSRRSENWPRVGFLGRVHPVKAVAELAGAVVGLVREFPGIRLALAGPWENGYRRAIEQKAGEGSGMKLEWAGLLGPAEKWRFLRGCDVVALPSHIENFGLAAGEALGVGKPVVVGRNTAWGFVEEAGLGAVVEPNPSSISAGLCRVLRSSSLADRVADEGPRLIRETYNWQRAGEALEKVYERALGVRS